MNFPVALILGVALALAGATLLTATVFLALVTVDKRRERARQDASRRTDPPYAA